MTHIENIPHILIYGITQAQSANANLAFVPIGDKSLITTRGAFQLNNGKTLGQYVPFYFGTRTPMLYVVQKGFNAVTPIVAENIVYCVSSVQKIIDEKLDFIFTDGHAVDSFSTQYCPDDVKDLENIIDWNAVGAKYWKDENDLDMKRRKEAEFLILGDIPISGIIGYIVYNDLAQNRLISFGIAPNKIVIKNNCYFNL